MAQAPKTASTAPVSSKAPATGNGEAKPSGDLTVSAKLADFDKVISVQYNFGADIEEMIELFGADVVYNKAMDSMVIDAQSKLRRHLKAELVGDKKDGKKIPLPKDIQELFADWKPAAGSKERKSALEKAQTLIGRLNDEERKSLIAQIRAAV